MRLEVSPPLYFSLLRFYCFGWFFHCVWWERQRVSFLTLPILGTSALGFQSLAGWLTVTYSVTGRVSVPKTRLARSRKDDLPSERPRRMTLASTVARDWKAAASASTEMQTKPTNLPPIPARSGNTTDDICIRVFSMV